MYIVRVYSLPTVMHNYEGHEKIINFYTTLYYSIQILQ